MHPFSYPLPAHLQAEARVAAADTSARRNHLFRGAQLLRVAQVAAHIVLWNRTHPDLRINSQTSVVTSLGAQYSTHQCCDTATPTQPEVSPTRFGPPQQCSSQSPGRRKPVSLSAETHQNKDDLRDTSLNCSLAVAFFFQMS